MSPKAWMPRTRDGLNWRWPVLAMEPKLRLLAVPTSARGPARVAEVLGVLLVRSPTAAVHERRRGRGIRAAARPALKRTVERTQASFSKVLGARIYWPRWASPARGCLTRAALGRPAGFAAVWPVRIVLMAQSAAGQQRPDAKPGPEADRAGDNQRLWSIQRPAAGEPLFPVQAGCHAAADYGRRHTSIRGDRTSRSSTRWIAAEWLHRCERSPTSCCCLRRCRRGRPACRRRQGHPAAGWTRA